MLKIGLTGGIGSGKSSATDIFKKLGVPVIDADIIAHQLTSPGTDTLQEIGEKLGQQFITPQGELDRKKIAQFVFNHPDQKTILEDILHPRVREMIISELQKLDTSPYVILAIPLLLETDFTDLVDRILVIDAPDDIRVQRVVERDGRSADDVKSIMSHQVNRQIRLKKADDVLDNSGTLADLQSLIELQHHQYLQIANQQTT